MLQDDEVLILVRMIVWYVESMIGCCQSGGKARHDAWNIQFVAWVLWINGCKRLDDASNTLSVGDWVLSVRGCKARDDASNILSEC